GSCPRFSPTNCIRSAAKALRECHALLGGTPDTILCNNQPRPKAVVLGRPPRGGRLREEAPVGGVSLTDLLVCKTFRRDFGMITEWYLHSHRTWDQLCHPSVGSSFMPLGALLEEGADGV